MKKNLLWSITSLFFSIAISNVFCGDATDTKTNDAIAAVQKALTPEEKIVIIEDVNEYMKSLALRSDIEDSFHIVNLEKLQDRYELWKKVFPNVTPFYAVKTNNDRAIVAMMAHLGSGFDCASKGELSQLLSLGVSPERIIFAHPRKPDDAMRYAIQKGVRKAVLDSQEELERMERISPDWEYVIRIKTHDEHSGTAFSKKFGASIDDAKKIMDFAFSQQRKINIVGVSFHVGSNNKDANSYVQAIKDAASLFNYASEKWNRELSLLDVGGGWVGGDDEYFKIQANAVTETVKSNFKPDVRVIAEPGRYFATETTSIAMRIIGKRQIEKEGKKTFEYFMTNGAYGMFLTSITYGYKLPKFEEEGWHFKSLFPSKDTQESLYETRLWGPASDSCDYIADNVMLPEMKTGDFIFTATAGAYTYSTQTNFNNIPLSKPYYACEQKNTRSKR